MSEAATLTDTQLLACEKAFKTLISPISLPGPRCKALLVHQPIIGRELFSPTRSSMSRFSPDISRDLSLLRNSGVKERISEASVSF